MMRSLLIVAVMLAGCVTTQDLQARRHADNLTAAAKEGYQVANKDGQTLFCPTRPEIGSHVVAGCLTEAQWEQRELSVSRGSIWTSSSGEGRTDGGSGGPYVGH
jgi:hypothetical protein